jgi:single-strand DNA-binding protein
MFNQITLLGNLTRDIELKYAQSGSAIASTCVATSHKFKVNDEKREDVMFIDLTFFGRSAEIANEYLRKGSKVFITGRLKLDQWVDKDGQKRSKHIVIVETMKMLDNKQDNSGDQEKQSYKMPKPTYERQETKPMPQNTMPEIDINEDEIPF